jgi:hypothetical protein
VFNKSSIPFFPCCHIGISELAQHSNQGFIGRVEESGWLVVVRVEYVFSILMRKKLDHTEQTSDH